MQRQNTSSSPLIRIQAGALAGILWGSVQTLLVWHTQDYFRAHLYFLALDIASRTMMTAILHCLAISLILTLIDSIPHPRLSALIVTLLAMPPLLHAQPPVYETHSPLLYLPWILMLSKVTLVILISELLRRTTRLQFYTKRLVTICLALVLLHFSLTGILKSHLANRLRQSGAANILLISLDSLRADRLGCYGSPDGTSPVLDRLARFATQYSNAFSSSSWTLPTHATLFTGLPPSHHRIVNPATRLSPEQITLPERLSNLGYQTASFISAPYLGRTYGFHHGFRQFFDRASSATRIESHQDITSPEISHAVSNWLSNQNPRHPFFGFIHYWDIHYDYIPPEPYNRIFDPDYTGHVTGHDFETDPLIHQSMAKPDLHHLLALYDGEIRWTDRHLEQVLRTLSRCNLLASTRIIVFSDHGDAFFEHDLRGHGNTLFGELIQIPLLILIPPGFHQKLIPETVDTIAIHDGILKYLESPRDQKQAMVRVNKSPAGSRSTIVAELDPVLDCLIQMPWKLIRHRKTGERQLFDLTTDPREHKDLSTKYPALTEELAAQLIKVQSKRNRSTPAGQSFILDGKTRDQLEALGYVN